jgi:multidrug resistance efflux pump
MVDTHHSGRKRGFRIAGVVFVLACAGLAYAVYSGKLPNPLTSAHATASDKSPKSSTTTTTTVKVVKPKKTAAVPITVDNIATVEPYYRADLRARASGIVRKVHHDIGEKVKAGEVLIEIDVPETEQEVAKAEAMILQRQQELKVSEAKLKDAKAARDVSAATVKQRLADVEATTATRDLKKRKYTRFQELAARGTVVGSVVEEEERDYLTSEASVTASKANVERARADYAESESKIEAAEADIELKKAQILVARKELERAKAVAEYSRVTAPFDGVVVRRNVDPGSFVQNATTGTSEFLISIAKVDLVTISARFPDSVAPFMAAGIDATVQIDDLPGVNIAAKVTRFAPSVQNADHTMRVEVDLFNGSDEEYRQLEEAIRSGGPNRPTKGPNDPVPLRAFASDVPNAPRLIPGMSGSITLRVGGFGESFVVPSSAVYSRSGTNYLLLVENGTTRQVPVRTQVTDGKSARVAIIERKSDARGSNREVLRDLTGNEEIVGARQLEIGEGASVMVSISDW